MNSKEDDSHHDEDDNFGHSVCSLEKDDDHEEKRPSPDEPANFVTIPAESEESVVNMCVVSFEWRFFHDKHSVNKNPDSIEDRYRKCYEDSSDLCTSEKCNICENKSKEHRSDISESSDRLIFYGCIDHSEDRHHE